MIIIKNYNKCKLKLHCYNSGHHQLISPLVKIFLHQNKHMTAYIHIIKNIFQLLLTKTVDPKLFLDPTSVLSVKIMIQALREARYHLIYTFSFG